MIHHVTKRIERFRVCLYQKINIYIIHELNRTFIQAVMHHRTYIFGALNQTKQFETTELGEPIM